MLAAGSRWFALDLSDLCPMFAHVGLLHEILKWHTGSVDRHLEVS